jgi:arginine decarboxylase
LNSSAASDLLADPTTDDWHPDKAADCYRMDSWSDAYFFVNEEGHVAMSPSRDREQAIDVYTVVQHLREQDIALPVLIRFQDVLQGRVTQLNEAFRRAIDAYDYDNRYVGVYPIKVNQLHEVVEEVLEAGQPYGMGLECGSKAELIAALPHLQDDATPLLCNGYKDDVMLRLILTGQHLGKNIIPVMEKFDEFERLMRLSDEMDVQPRFGVRVQLATRGAGQWAASSGSLSKFGISVADLLVLIDRLRDTDQLEALALLHFHLGSQISDIQTLKRAVKEITHVYAQLRQRDVPVEYIDVGGGLGVNYGASYGHDDDAINYTLQEYANSIVYAVKEVCDDEEVPHPTLVSESGRALTAHHSVLIVEVLEAYQKKGVAPDFALTDEDDSTVLDLYDALQQAQQVPATPEAKDLATLREAYHDAIEKRQEADTLFSLGYLPIEQLALADRLYWTICRTIYERMQGHETDTLPAELLALNDLLIDQYLCNFSVFQSILDHWAIGQRFPIMPIHRLDEAPLHRAQLVDLTCDSDGKVRQYIGTDPEQEYLDVHPLNEGEPYHLGFFLMGAYQDIMGDMHNLFGRPTEVHVYADEEEPDGYYIETLLPGETVEQMLAKVQYFPNDLHRRMNTLIRAKVADKTIRPKSGVQILEQYTQAFKEMTYLK